MIAVVERGTRALVNFRAGKLANAAALSEKGEKAEERGLIKVRRSSLGVDSQGARFETGRL